MSEQDHAPKPPICGAHFYIGDDHGDNEATMVCNLPPAHDGRHCCVFPRRGQKMEVVLSWDTDERPPKLNKLQVRYSQGVIEKFHQTVDYDINDPKSRRLFMRYTRASNRLRDDARCWGVNHGEI